jgi:hypothetical protein
MFERAIRISAAKQLFFASDGNQQLVNRWRVPGLTSNCDVSQVYSWERPSLPKWMRSKAIRNLLPPALLNYYQSKPASKATEKKPSEEKSEKNGKEAANKDAVSEFSEETIQLIDSNELLHRLGSEQLFLLDLMNASSRTDSVASKLNSYLLSKV